MHVKYVYEWNKRPGQESCDLDQVKTNLVPFGSFRVPCGLFFKPAVSVFKDFVHLTILSTQRFLQPG